MNELPLSKIILLISGVWTTSTILLGWILLRCNKQHRKAQQIKYPEA
jgi:hypothetical protein